MMVRSASDRRSSQHSFELLGSSSGLARQIRQVVHRNRAEQNESLHYLRSLKRASIDANRRFLPRFTPTLDNIRRWTVFCRPSTSIGARPRAVIALFEFRAAAAIPATFTRFFLAAGFSNAIACAFFSRHGFLSYSRYFQLYRPTP